jgi:hypothetical protein
MAKPIVGWRSREKNSGAGRSFWLLSRIGHRYEAFRKGRVKRTELQRPNSFLASFPSFSLCQVLLTTATKLPLPGPSTGMKNITTGRKFFAQLGAAGLTSALRFRSVRNSLRQQRSAVNDWKFRIAGYGRLATAGRYRYSCFSGEVIGHFDHDCLKITYIHFAMREAVRVLPLRTP